MLFAASQETGTHKLLTAAFQLSLRYEGDDDTHNGEQSSQELPRKPTFPLIPKKPVTLASVSNADSLIFSTAEDEAPGLDDRTNELNRHVDEHFTILKEARPPFIASAKNSKGELSAKSQSAETLPLFGLGLGALVISCHQALLVQTKSDDHHDIGA